MYLDSISPFIRAMLVRNADGSVTAPDNILKTVSAAYQQYTTLRSDHIERIKVYAAIEGMIGGNTPYSQEELEENGLGHITNYNNFKARSSYEKSAGGFWNLINSTEVFVKIVLGLKIPKATEYAAIIARHFSDIVKEWEDFAPNFNLLGAQLVKFGLCPVIFPHEESPMWEVVDVSRFYIPSNAQTFISKLSNVSVDTTYTVQELYQIYEKAEDGGPWNREALGDFLILRANALTANTQAPVFDMLTWQRFINNNDATANQYFTDTVRLVNMYQKEYDGKISHYIFSSDMFNNVSVGSDVTTQDFMYFVDRQYNTMEEAIIVFTASPGEWCVHGNLGLGQKMYAASQAINMLDCSIVDMAKMSSTPLIRTLATGGRNAEAIRFWSGVPTDIGAAEFVQNNLGANIEQLVGASQYLTQSIDMNAINSGDDPSVPDRAQGSISPSEARQRSFKEFGVLKNIVAHFYNTFDKVVRLTFVRFLTMKEGAPGWELAKEFKRRCLEDGVPEILFDTGKKGLHGLPVQFRSVKAARVAGDGSTLARIMGLESLQTIAPTFNPPEMAAWKREWVTATMGVDYVDTFATDDVGDEITGGASLAKVENGLMSLGKEVLFSPDNDQSAHADEHMGEGSRLVQAVSQQQMSPVDADKIAALLLPHLTEHVQFMARAPMFYAETMRRIEEPYNQFVRWAQLNRRNAQAMITAAMRKQQEDAAATQEVMSDAQRKDFVAQKDAERADFKVQKQVERSDKANETRAAVMMEKVEKDAEIKRRQVELEAENKRMATAKGRSQEELMNTPPEVLSSQLSGIIGNTPSTVDFE